MSQPHNHPPFFGRTVIPREEGALIEELLAPYKRCAVSEELLQKIWSILQQAKAEGKIVIPFKVAIKRHPLYQRGDYIEVLLDNKV